MDDENILRNSRPPMGCLLIDGKRYPTYKGINTVGRCTSATVTLKSLDISKQHAIITVVGENEHYVSDFQSFNGTFLKGSKLSPLVLYQLKDNSKIDFGSVTATYNMVTPATYENYYLNSLFYTQTATQTLYDATTQTVEKEISIRNSSPNVQQDNFFDDDYSFDDISTQMINESVNSTRPVFKIPVSIHEAPTQEVRTDNTSVVVDDVTDIHNMETQKLDLNPVIKISDHLNINEIPTQILTLENEKENFDSTSIIDETVLNDSNFEVPEAIISEDSDSQSALHVSQLYRRSTKPISDSEESDPSISEVICDTQSSDEVLKCKQKRRLVIESDSETDVENLDENIKNDLGFDTDRGVETNIEKFGSINHPVPKTVHINSIAGIESDSDANDFEFNAQISDQSKSDSIQSSKNYENSIDNDDVIPGTQLNEEVLNENKIKDSSKIINSVDDMDSLYLEATQIIGHDSDTDKKNDSSLSDCENVCKRSLELNEQVQECSTNLIEPEVNSILEKRDQFSSTIVKHKSNVSKNSLNQLDDSQSQNEYLLLVQSQPKPSVMKTPHSPIRVDSSALEAHNLYFEETQPIGIDQQKLSEIVKGNDEEFLKNSQPVLMTSDEYCKQMRCVNEAESTFESYRCQQKKFGTTKKNDDIFLEPTQPLTIANDQTNKGVKRIQSTLSPNQEQHNTEETDDVFLKPTQPLHFDYDKKHKRAKDAMDVFLQPIQSNLSLHGEQHDYTEEMDDIFLVPTQPLHFDNGKRSKRVKDAILPPTQSNLSRHGEEPDNAGETDNIFLEPTQPLSIANDQRNKGVKRIHSTLSPNQELHNAEESDDIYLEPTQPLHFDNDKKSKTEIQSNLSPHEEQLDNTGETDNIFLEPTQPLNVFNDHRSTRVKSAEDVLLKSTQSILSPQQQQLENIREADDVCLDVTPTTVSARDKKGIEELEYIFLEPTKPIVEGTNIVELTKADEVISESTRLLVINNDFTSKEVEKSDMKPAIPKTDKIKDQKEKDQIILEYSSPINVAINQNDHDKKKTPLAQKIRSLENLTNTSVENKLKEIFATQKLSTNNEIQSQFEVLFESQNVYYRSDVSERPKNPLLNEFESGNRNEYLNTDDLGTSPTPLIPEEKNLPNSDLNITNCIEGGSKNVDKPKRLSLSLKSNLRLGSDKEIKSYEKFAKIPNKFCKNDEVETKNNTEEPTNSISNKPNDSKISKSETVSENFKKILDKSSSTYTEEVKSSTFNDDTVRLMRSGTRLRNSKTTNLTDITRSPETVDVENDSSKSTKTRAPSTRSRTTIHNNLDDNIHTANLQEMKSPQTSKCTRTRTRSRNQNRDIESKEIIVSFTSSNSRKFEKEQASQLPSVKKTETTKAIINQDDTNSCKADKEVDKKLPTKFTDHQLNNPLINTNKRKLLIATTNKELPSESQEPNIHTVRKTRRVEFDVIESKPVQLTLPNKKKRTYADVPSTSRTKQRKMDVDEVNIDTPVKSVSQSSTMDNATPDRNKRKQKPKVVFTMLDSPELESVIRSLGGTVVNSVESCTVLVTTNLKRTQKLLAAVGQAKPICSPKWLQDSKKARQFLDPWEYILEDKDAESSWNVSLKQSLLKSQTQKLLHNYLVYVTVTNSVDVLKAAIESCGGKCVTKAPSKLNNEKFIVVANPENKSKYSKFLKRDPPTQIVLPEAIFDGVLRQELRFQDHLIL